MSNNIHDGICTDLESRLITKPYVKKVETHIIYEKGEVDVLATLINNNQVYFEVKCNYTEKGYIKGIDQLFRWTWYMYNTENKIDYWGVFYSRQYVNIICKNGTQFP